MGNEILYLLLDNYADHESVFLAEAINCNENGIRKNPKYINKVVAPTLSPIRSCGGFRTIPDYSFDTMPDEYAALILIGGYGWLDDKTTDKVVPIVKKAIEKRIIVGAICSAAVEAESQESFPVLIVEPPRAVDRVHALFPAVIFHRFEERGGDFLVVDAVETRKADALPARNAVVFFLDDPRDAPRKLPVLIGEKAADLAVLQIGVFLRVGDVLFVRTERRDIIRAVFIETERVIRKFAHPFFGLYFLNNDHF